MLGCILKIDLVGSNAEAPNDNQVLGLFQHPRCEPGFRPDTNNVHITVKTLSDCSVYERCIRESNVDLPYFGNQLILRKRGFIEIYLVALLGQIVTACLIYVLEEKDLDILSRKGFQLFCESTSGRSRQLWTAITGRGRVEQCTWRCGETEAGGDLFGQPIQSRRDILGFTSRLHRAFAP